MTRRDAGPREVRNQRPGARRGTAAGRDSVDAFTETARRIWPGLDWELEAATDRIIRIGRYLEQAARHRASAVPAVDPSARGCQVLVSLRGSGPPHRVTPSALRRQLLISSGAMTNVLSRLEAAGMLVRLPDVQDGRGIMVELTSLGQQAADQIIGAASARQTSILNALSRPELAELSNLLRKLNQRVDHEAGRPQP